MSGSAATVKTVGGGPRNRQAPGLAPVAVVAVHAFRGFPGGHGVRRGDLLSVVSMITEALVGAALVLFAPLSENDSIHRGFGPWLVVVLALGRLA